MNRKTYRAFYLHGNLIQFQHYLVLHHWRLRRRKETNFNLIVLLKQQALI